MSHEEVSGGHWNHLEWNPDQNCEFGSVFSDLILNRDFSFIIVISGSQHSFGISGSEKQRNNSFMTSFVKNILILDEIETLTGYIVFENAELKFTSSYVFAFK